MEEARQRCAKRTQSESGWTSMGEDLRDWGVGNGGAGGEQQEREDMEAQPRRRAGQSGCQEDMEAYVRRIADELPPPLDALVQGMLFEIAGSSALAMQRDAAQEEDADDAAVPDVSWLGGEEGEEQKRVGEHSDAYKGGGGVACTRSIASRSFRAAQLAMEGHFLLTLTAILMDNRQLTVMILPLSPEANVEPSTLAHRLRLVLDFAD
jgi:hypothetical protein